MFYFFYNIFLNNLILKLNLHLSARRQKGKDTLATFLSKISFYVLGVIKIILHRFYYLSIIVIVIIKEVINEFISNSVTAIYKKYFNYVRI